jgi:hypothetical protein
MATDKEILDAAAKNAAYIVELEAEQQASDLAFDIVQQKYEVLRDAAQVEIDAQQDRYAANSDSELAKANAKYEVAYDNLKAALEKA